MQVDLKVILLIFFLSERLLYLTTTVSERILRQKKASVKHAEAEHAKKELANKKKTFFNFKKLAALPP